MYTKDQIEEVPTGWNMSILDPQGDTVATLRYVMVPGERWRPYVEQTLNGEADILLSHLNR